MIPEPLPPPVSLIGTFSARRPAPRERRGIWGFRASYPNHWRSIAGRFTPFSFSVGPHSLTQPNHANLVRLFRTYDNQGLTRHAWSPSSRFARWAKGTRLEFVGSVNRYPGGDVRFPPSCVRSTSNSRHSWRGRELPQVTQSGSCHTGAAKLLGTAMVWDLSG